MRAEGPSRVPERGPSCTYNQQSWPASSSRRWKTTRSRGPRTCRSATGTPSFSALRTTSGCATAKRDWSPSWSVISPSMRGRRNTKSPETQRWVGVDPDLTLGHFGILAERERRVLPSRRRSGRGRARRQVATALEPMGGGAEGGRAPRRARQALGRGRPASVTGVDRDHPGRGCGAYRSGLADHRAQSRQP